MIKYITIAVSLMVAIMSLSCEEPLVGAPCVPETDDGQFSTNLGADQYSVETRSVQCETSVCITATKINPDNGPDEGNPDIYKKYLDTQFKYSFCSCRCADSEGHEYDRGNDKFDRLCVCPGNSVCNSVLPLTVGVAPQTAGSYCIPKCILNGCEAGSGEICSPSKNSDEPWKWRCTDPD